jgi:hypothetical protein
MKKSEKNGWMALGLGVAALALLGAAAPKARPPAPPPKDYDPIVRRVHGAFLRACAVLGVTPPILRADFSVAAFQARPGIVEFNPDWAERLVGQYCNTMVCEVSVLVGILAHELGHVFFGVKGYDLSQCQANHDGELRADAVAGWVLAKLNFPRHHLELVLGELSKEASCTHPEKDFRVAAIRHGYDVSLRGEPWGILKLATFSRR